MTPPQHLWLFSMATLEELLRRTGFTVLETTHPSKRVPLNLALFLGRYAGRFSPALSFFAKHAPPVALPVNLFDERAELAIVESFFFGEPAPPVSMKRVSAAVSSAIARR